jgi:hypothetical protein
MGAAVARGVSALWPLLLENTLLSIGMAREAAPENARPIDPK